MLFYYSFYRLFYTFSAEMFSRRSLRSVHWARLFDQGSMHCKSVFSGNDIRLHQWTFLTVWTPGGPWSYSRSKQLWAMVDGCVLYCLYTEVISCVQNSVTVCALFTPYVSLDHIRDAVDGSFGNDKKTIIDRFWSISRCSLKTRSRVFNGERRNAA